MAETLPEPITPKDVSTLKAGALADLEDLVDMGLESYRAVTVAYAALAVIKDKKLYGDSFEDYCYERFGISRTSGWRWVLVGRAMLKTGSMEDAPSQRSLTSKKDEGAGENVPRRGTSDPGDEDRAGEGDTPAAEDEPPLSDGSGPSPSPAGSTSPRGTQDPSPHVTITTDDPDATARAVVAELGRLPSATITQEDYRRFVARILSAGVEPFKRSCKPDQLAEVAALFAEAAGLPPTEPSAVRLLEDLILAGAETIAEEATSELIKAANRVVTDAYYILEPDKAKTKKPAAPAGSARNPTKRPCTCEKDPKPSLLITGLCTACHGWFK